MRKITLPNRLIKPLVLVSSATILLVDFLTGPDVRFTILYVVPVAYAAWQWKFRWALVLALTMPMLRLGFAFAWGGLPTLSTAGINTIIQWSTLIGIAALISRMIALQKRIQVLEGILPICSFCKKIRGPGENWERIEDYITSHSEVLFSHGFCPTCARQHYPEIFNQEPSP